MKIGFKRLTEKNLAMVLKWRTDKKISQWLFTDVDNDYPKQVQWFRKLQDDDQQRFWIATVDHVPVGAFFLKDIDWLNGTAELGYYFDQCGQNGIGAFVTAAFYTWTLDNAFKKFRILIFADHDRLVPLHYAHGYKLVRVWPRYKRGRDVLEMELTQGQYKGFIVTPREFEI